MSIPPSLPQSTAIAAFLRGIDRRAQLLARVQAGEAATAEQALRVSQRVFVSEAHQWPIAQWPMQYWRLLLSIPAMGHAASAGDHSPLPAIAQLPPPARAAVLLHLVASLEEADAANALGTTVPAYQQRIRDALPRDAQGQPDLVVWRDWREAAQHALSAAVDTAPASPPAHVPEPQGAPALAPPGGAIAPARPTVPAPTPPQPSHHRLLRGLWLGVAVGVLALIATFFLHPRGRVMWDEWQNRVRVEALPEAAAPKARYHPNDPAQNPDSALWANPQELLLARDLPLLAWLATQPEALPDASPGTTTPLPAWDHTDRRLVAFLRGALAEWQALTEHERQLLRATAARFHALPPAQQQNLRQRYAQQPYDAHRGWHLGPQLGRDWPRIAPLFTFIDANERAALLQLLRNIHPNDLDTLARLAQTTPPEARAALRRDLLAQAPEQRSAWLLERLQH